MPKQRVLGTCEQCDQPAVIRTMCRKHYQRWLRKERTDRPCSVADCARGLYASGLCNLHYLRQRKYGSTDSRQQPIHDRFWSKVDKNGPIPEYAPHLGPCWVWTAALRVGYGAFGLGGHSGGTVGAHVWAYEEINGPTPKGMHVDHLCRTPACVRPDHLEAVTPRENWRRGAMADLGTPPHCPTCSCDGHR